MFVLPVIWDTTPTSVVPMKDAPLPHISRMPKYSPDFSGGISLAKWDRERAWIPPWKRPTHTASTQNWAWVARNMA